MERFFKRKVSHVRQKSNRAHEQKSILIQEETRSPRTKFSENCMNGQEADLK